MHAFFFCKNLIKKLICRIFLRCISKCFTFRYGRQAVRIASTVKSERAKPTKNVCSGRSPSLYNHLGENTGIFGSLHSTKEAPLTSSSWPFSVVGGSLTRELGRFSFWLSPPTSGNTFRRRIFCIQVYVQPPLTVDAGVFRVRLIKPMHYATLPLTSQMLQVRCHVAAGR